MTRRSYIQVAADEHRAAFEEKLRAGDAYQANPSPANRRALEAALAAESAAKERVRKAADTDYGGVVAPT